MIEPVKRSNDELPFGVAMLAEGAVDFQKQPTCWSLNVKKEKFCHGRVGVEKKGKGERVELSNFSRKKTKSLIGRVGKDSCTCPS